MIVVENLKKTFGKVEAVKRVSFRAEDGAITGLLGENGAGKTTTIRSISGILEPSDGSILIDGHRVVFGETDRPYSLGVLSDARGLAEKLTSVENIVYFGRMSGVSEADIKSRLDNIIQLLDMESIAHRRTEGFSTGQRVKVALARILISDPKNLVLDEPSSGLDVMSTRKLRDILRHLRDQGKCIVFTTHVMQEVEALCEEIMIMHEGTSLVEGKLEDLVKRANCDSLEDAFVNYLQGEV